MGAFVYVLRCADGSYYVGTTRGALENRVGEHNAGHFGGFTASRRPVHLVFAQEFDRITDAIAAERQVKGWRRDKKEALIRGEFELLKLLAKRGGSGADGRTHPSRRALAGAPQDEEPGVDAHIPRPEEASTDARAPRPEEPAERASRRTSEGSDGHITVREVP
jgi:predicted GIY-YIG superfamily endonuclease